MGQLSHSFHYRNRKVFLCLYVQDVRPHLEYSSSAWSPWSANDVEVLENVQKKAINIIFGLKPGVYEKRLKELSLWTLKKRKVVFNLFQMCKIAHSTET